MLLTCLRGIEISSRLILLYSRVLPVPSLNIFSFLFCSILGVRYSASSSLYSQVLLSICHADFSIECPTTIKALFLPPVDCQPVMACTVKGILGTDYCPGSLCNDGFQLFVLCVIVLLFTCDFIIPRTHTTPLSQMLFRREGFHIDTYFCYQVFYCFSAKSGG